MSSTINSFWHVKLEEDPMSLLSRTRLFRENNWIGVFGLLKVGGIRHSVDIRQVALEMFYFVFCIIGSCILIHFYRLLIHRPCYSFMATAQVTVQAHKMFANMNTRQNSAGSIFPVTTYIQFA